MPPRVLLSSVFKPFAVNDMYSRKESILELLHNQLTKYQGIYSLRTAYDSHGIHAIANNLGVPCTVLDFPTRNRFIREVKKGYDYIGISSIVQNFQKVKWMAEQIRELSPRTKIIVGGFCAGIPDLQKVLDVDYVCVGEGISFMRELLGLPPEFEFKNPDISTDYQGINGGPVVWHGQNPPDSRGAGLFVRLRLLLSEPFFRTPTYQILQKRQGIVRGSPAHIRKIRIEHDYLYRR